MKLVRLKSSAVAVLCLGACSCRGLYPATHSAEAERLPSSYSKAAEQGVAASNLWWQSFGSVELNELVGEALAGNLSLAGAAARLRQARAVAQAAGATRFPDLSGTAGVAWSDQHSTAADGSKTSQSSESYDLGVAASYEVDLWGRVAALRNRSQLDAASSRFDLETVAMTLSARVVDLWLRTVEAKAQVRLLEDQVQTNREIFDLLKDRLVKARTPLLDVYQQEQVLRATEGLLPLARQRLDLLGNELAVVLGRPVGKGPQVLSRELPVMPAQLRTGVPADLLSRRPDIRSQWSRLEAAGSAVAAARADRLPAIRLTARQEYNSVDTGSLFDNWLSSLAGSLTAPLFDGGRRRAEEARTRALLEERLAAYRATVLEAMRDVEDALVFETRLGERLTALEQQSASADRVLAEAERRYRKGAIDYLAVLSSLRGKQQLERDLLDVRRQLLSNRVALYRALGGSWNDTAQEALQRNVVDQLTEYTSGAPSAPAESESRRKEAAE